MIGRRERETGYCLCSNRLQQWVQIIELVDACQCRVVVYVTILCCPAQGCSRASHMTTKDYINNSQINDNELCTNWWIMPVFSPNESHCFSSLFHYLTFYIRGLFTWTLNLESRTMWIAAILFSFGRDVLCEFDYWSVWLQQRYAHSVKLLYL